MQSVSVAWAIFKAIGDWNGKGDIKMANENKQQNLKTKIKLKVLLLTFAHEERVCRTLQTAKEDG